MYRECALREVNPVQCTGSPGPNVYDEFTGLRLINSELSTAKSLCALHLFRELCLRCTCSRH